MSVQTEIPIPMQPRRVSLGHARFLRDRLEKQLQRERPQLATEVTAIALHFPKADTFYRLYRPSFYRKRTLDQLHTLGCFIAALERKR